MLINVYFRSFYTFLKKNLLELNLFRNGIQDEFTIQNQRRSTRLYLFLLFTLILIIGFYYSIITYTETVIIKSPSYIQYSAVSDKTSLECFCTKIAVKYEAFIEIAPIYHELCYSDFISDEYINQLYSLYEQTWNNSVSTDFHRIAVFQFKTLHKFCQLTQETIKTNLEIFLQTEFIQTKLISEESLETQIASVLEDFIDFTPKTFLRTLMFIQNITAQSLFMTGASLTSVLPRRKLRDDMNDIPSYDGITYRFADGSSCTCSSSTSNICMGLTTFQNNIVPGFKTGCYMLSALLKSTVEVFYNQTFINILTNSSDRFQKLNSSISNNTIEKLLGQMFITHWTKKTFFQRYFNQCAPDPCQYIVIKHNDLLFIITSLIGLFGGLSSILNIIVPLTITTIWPMISKFINRQGTSMAHNVDIQIHRVSIGNRIKNTLRLINRKLVELNFFTKIPPSQDENILRQERFITRIYLVLLFSSLIIIIVFTSITPQTISFIIKSPSLKDFIQLNDQYPLTLSCPCSKTAIDRLFISDIKPQYYEICSSAFISSDWINLQFIQSPSIQLYTRDIRYELQFHFQLLSTLCKMANQTIEDSLQSFYRTKFITSQALSPQSFQTQINIIIENFKITVSEPFQRILNLVKTNFEINQFITPMNSNFDYKLRPIGIFLSTPGYAWQRKTDCPSTLNIVNGRCICYSTSLNECYQNIIININETQDIIPGMLQTWFPLQSLLMSTLECFYNDTCLYQIKQLINSTVSPTNFTKLKSSSLSLISNNQYDRIDLLANNLFIQSWNNESSFESYFNQCHPLTCQYTIQTRLNLVYIVTRIAGLIGGIDLALSLSLPFIIKLMTKIWHYILQLKRNNPTRTGATIPIRRRFYNQLRILFISSKQYLVELNLFPTIPPSQDPKIIHRSRRLTRIYLILLVVASFILILYALLRQETSSVTVESPTISKYRELFYQYPLTLKCSCSRTAIKYTKFISQNEPQYHEICSSVFVSSEWFNNIETRIGVYTTWYSVSTDYRDFLPVQFQALSQLCSISRNVWNKSLSVFGQNDFITSNTISHVEFDVRTKTILKQFITSVSEQFMETLKLIQLTNDGNQLATIFSSNWEFTSKYGILDIDRTANQPMHLLTEPIRYSGEDCSCGIQSNCSALSYIILWPHSSQLNQIMPAFRVGCFYLDSLLQSSLACFYNKTCLGLMQAGIYYSKPVKTDILTYSSLLIPNTTIETILSYLFVSEWFQNASFDLYFNECAPQSCQYSYSMQYNLAYVITLLIAVFGGLTNGIHFVVYYTEFIVMKLINCRKKENIVAPYPQRLEITMINQDNNAIEETSIPTTSAEQQNTSRRKYIDRAIIICLSLLAIGGIVTTFIIVLMDQDKEDKFISTSTQTTLISSSSNPTTETTNTCFMTLKYQSQTYPTDLNPVSMVTGDFNKDSIVDLAVTNFLSDTLSVMLGNGDGTFQRQQVYSTGYGSRPQEIKTADFNNDTFLDLVVTLSATKGIVIFFGVAASYLFLSPPYNFPFYTYDEIPNMIEVGDLNNDGFMDLVVSRYSDTSSMTDKLSVFLNHGDGYQFDSGSPNTFWGSNNIFSIVIGDFNHDGMNYLRFSADDSSVKTYYGMPLDDSYEYGFGNTNGVYGYPSVMTKGRFNQDAFDDCALISSQSDTLSIIFSITYGWSYQHIYLTESYPVSIVPINFNNDLIDDLAILNCNGTLTVFLGENIGLFDQDYLSFKLNISNNGTCFNSLKVADLNQDGKDDLVFIDTEMSSIRVVLGSPCKE